MGVAAVPASIRVAELELLIFANGLLNGVGAIAIVGQRFGLPAVEVARYVVAFCGEVANGEYAVHEGEQILGRYFKTQVLSSVAKLEAVILPGERFVVIILCTIPVSVLVLDLEGSAEGGGQGGAFVVGEGQHVILVPIAEFANEVIDGHLGLDVHDGAHALAVAAAAILIPSPFVPSELTRTAVTIGFGIARPIGAAFIEHIINTPARHGQEDAVAVGTCHPVARDAKHFFLYPVAIFPQFLEL